MNTKNNAQENVAVNGVPKKIGELISEFNTILLEESVLPMSTGFPSLDSVIKGLYPGEFLIVGARPAMGKSAFVLSCAKRLLKADIPVALFSATDTCHGGFLHKVVACLTDTDCNFEAPFAPIDATLVENMPFYIDLHTDLTVDYLREKASILVRDHGVKCIFVDTIQSIFVAEDTGITRESMEQICWKLKKLASDLQVPFIYTSDLNRQVENRREIEGKYPQLADLRESSAIECVSDVVILLHRPEYYCITEDCCGNSLKDVIYLIVAKNRYGLTQECCLRFSPRKCQILETSEWETDHMRNSNFETKFVHGLDMGPF